MLTITRNTRDPAARPDPALRTPYHSLAGGAEVRVPEWAQHRAVYRSSGRTLYVVGTANLADAKSDLRKLGRDGWEVQITRDPAGSGAQIALSRGDLARAA